MCFCALFWSGCDNESVVEHEALYGPPPCYQDGNKCYYQTPCTRTEYCSSSVVLECDGNITDKIPESLENCKAVNKPCEEILLCSNGTFCKENTQKDKKSYECTDFNPDGSNSNHFTYTESEFNNSYHIIQNQDDSDNDKDDVK